MNKIKKIAYEDRQRTIISLEKLIREVYCLPSDLSFFHLYANKMKKSQRNAVYSFYQICNKALDISITQLSLIFDVSVKTIWNYCNKAMCKEDLQKQVNIVEKL